MTTADVLRLQLDSSPLSSRVAVDDDDDVIARIRARAMTAGRRYTSRRRVATRSRQQENSGRRSKPELPVEEGDSSTDSEFYDTDLETDDRPDRAATNTNKGDKSDTSVRVYRDACAHGGVAPQEAIALALPETEVNIRYRCLGDEDGKAMCSALLNNVTVTRLELASNNIGSRGANYLKNVILFNTNIAYLDLSDNDLGRHIMSARTLGELLRANTSLETLKLAGNNFKDEDIMYLAVGIQMNSRLEQLDLSRNNIGETGGIHLGRAFAVNNGIDVLDLSWNCIRLKGAVGLCKGLQDNGYVSKLNIAWNGFGYEGSLAMGELLKKNSTLTEINLASNRIDWKGIQFIAKGFLKNKTVETVILDSNPLTTTGCMDLIEALSEPNNAVINLSLKGISVVGDFELLTMMIRQSRPEFTCVHGGIVNSHDIIGQRLEKRVTPLQKVMNFMKEREYRTTELFRMLDRDVTMKLTVDELAARLKHIGIRLPPHEVGELLDFINSQVPNKEQPLVTVNYKAMARGVKGHQDLQRLEKIREQEHEDRLKKWHRKILTDPEAAGVVGLGSVADVNSVLPPIDATPGDIGPRTLSMVSFMTGSNMAKTLASDRLGASTRFTMNSLGDGKKSSGLISMSTSLGAKAVPFGKADGKKKKKTSKKASKSSKKRTKAIKDTTDYDSMI